MQASGEKVCAVCQCSKQPAKACGRCKMTLYCGSECQKEDYKDHKDMCIIQNHYDKLFELFSNDKMYQSLLLQHVELDDKNQRGIVHVHLANGRSDLEIIINKERLTQGEAVDLEVKVLRVEESSVGAGEDATQWQIAQDYGNHYKVGVELPLVFTVPYSNNGDFYTRTYLLEVMLS